MTRIIFFTRRINILQIQFIIISAFLFFTSCNESTGKKADASDSLAIREAYAESPVLTPQESMNKMKLQDGFAIQLVASEPLVNSPVALTFDEKGRIWVVEMEGYMPDTVGTGEDKPTGKIVILSDKNGDGVMDDRKVFLDSLVLPRAICLVENGLLVAEPPRLWYVSNDNDKAGKKTLVDEKYAEGGNVEHQPNGLLRALDNWIYNAKSDKRYRKKGDQWLIENTYFRGQWGIAQDDYGRLFYNNNSANLLGDYYSPGFGGANKNQRRVSGFDERIVRDNHVYPLRPTPGVNRGYMKGILDDSLRLVEFTAASGPTIYRGNAFGKDYQMNAFVGEPSANLIKRNILEDSAYKVKGKQAYKQKEFLASADERFRPVSLYNAPDGALYVVDMYRGIIQHKTYLTDYLKNEIKSRKLEKPLTYGRIYKIVPQNKKLQPVILPADPTQLVALLDHPNGWVRDKAQQMIVDGKFINLVPTLRESLKQTDNPIKLIHSLWTLEGLGAIKPEDVNPLLEQKSWPIRMQALSVLPSVINKNNYKQYLTELQKLLDDKDEMAAPYLAFLAKTIGKFDKNAANQIINNLVKQYPKNQFVSDAIISNYEGQEAAFLKQITTMNPDTNLAINKGLRRVLADIERSKVNKNAKALEKEFPKGAVIFKSVCQTCHGADGNGIRALAPPLNESDWVNGSKSRLIPIVLYGLTGPIRVNGTLYQAPEINGDMPGIGNNKEFSDDDIAQLLSLIRKSWKNNADKVTAADIVKARETFKGRQKAFTMDELKRVK